MEIPIFEAGIIFFLLIFSGFFSASEVALFSLSLIQRERIRKSRKKGAVLIDRLLERPRRLIMTVQIGNDLVNIAASVFATFLFISLLGEGGKWATIAIMTPLTLMFAEVIPKTLAITHNEKVAPFVSRPLDLFAKLVAPLRWIFKKVAELILRLAGVKEQDAVPSIMEDDFRYMVDISHKGGELRGAERELIHNVFEFSDTYIFEIMTPLGKMFCLPDDMDINAAIKRAKESPFSRIPVYRESAGNIVGVLYVKDLLGIDLEKFTDRAKPLLKICKKPYFVPDTEKIDKLFYTLKQERTHIAVCVDKNGRVSGLVTMEDLLEELFGEIYDEYDRE